MEGVVRELGLFAIGFMLGSLATIVYWRRRPAKSRHLAQVHHSQPWVRQQFTSFAEEEARAADDPWFHSLDRFDRPRSSAAPVPPGPTNRPVEPESSPTSILAEDEQSLAIRLYSEDLEAFRERCRPLVVEPDRERLEQDSNELVLRHKSDGPYWLVGLPSGIGLVFPRAKRSFGRGMMHYGAAPALFEIHGFQDGVRYRRTIVRAPARVVAEGDIWRRHTKGVLDVTDGEPDE